MRHTRKDAQHTTNLQHADIPMVLLSGRVHSSVLVPSMSISYQRPVDDLLQGL
jgi:hypothetical protein